MDIKEIQNLIKFVAKSGASEVKLEMEDVKITIKTGSDSETTIVQQVPMAAAPQPMAVAPVAAAPVAAEAPAAISGDTINSPMVGTYYASPSPEAPAFVKVGDTVKKGQTLCILEAMKIMNEVEAEFDCKIVKLLVEDGNPVEYDMPIFAVEKI